MLSERQKKRTARKFEQTITPTADQALTKIQVAQARKQKKYGKATDEISPENVEAVSAPATASAEKAVQVAAVEFQQQQTVVGEHTMTKEEINKAIQ